MSQKSVFSSILVFTVSLLVAIPAVGDKLIDLPPEMVKVAIVREARELNLAIEGAYRLRLDSGKIIAQGARLAESKVRLLDKGVLIGLNVYPFKRLIIESVKKDVSILVDHHRFRGEIILIRTPDHRITLVNSINVEDYIKGVLYHEVSHHWPMETLKAQAVAARTYALYSISPQGKDYDVTNDIYSQVYGGRESERYRTGLAVDRTAGEILVYQGKVLPSYFYSTCAGMTEDAQDVWDMNLAPLKGVPCNFCKGSPHMQWKINARLKDFQNSLNHAGYKIGLIKDISIQNRDRSGRIGFLKIIDRNGQVLMMKGKDFREIVGPNLIKSNNYEITMKGYYVDLIGKGWGHGVGLCQWGAYGMAQQQFTYDQILSYYYPHAELINYHELKRARRLEYKTAVSK